MSQKFPIQLTRQKENEEVTAVTSIQLLTRTSRNIREELKFIEHDYTVLVKSVASAMRIASKSKKADVRLYWIGADAISGFLRRIDDLGFYLVKQNKTLGRDTGLSEGTIQRMLAFRKRFIRISQVNPSYSWAKYRANKVPVPKPTVNS